jgi:hypothetical protein
VLFNKGEVSDQHQIGRDQKLMRTEKSEEQHNVIIPFAYMIFQIGKYPVIELGLILNEDPSGNVDKTNKGHNKQTQYNSHLHRKKSQCRT